MDEQEQIWIERYLAGELSEQEIAKFHKRMMEDPAFNSEVELSKLALSSLRLAKRAELKAHFSHRDKIKVGSSSKYFIGVMAVLLIVSVLWFLSYKKSNPETIQYMDSKIDTALMNTDKPIIKDTMSIPKHPYPIAVKEIVPNNKENEIAKTPENAGELYAMHYTPFKDESLHIGLRGQNEMTSYTQFIQYYLASNYQATLSAFDSLGVSLQKSDNVLFIKANALMALNEIDEAQALFSNIIDRNKSRYINASKWYLAMCYLKENKLEEAKKIFGEVESKNTQQILNQLAHILNGKK